MISTDEGLCRFNCWCHSNVILSYFIRDWCDDIVMIRSLCELSCIALAEGKYSSSAGNGVF